MFVDRLIDQQRTRDAKTHPKSSVSLEVCVKWEIVVRIPPVQLREDTYSGRGGYAPMRWEGEEEERTRSLEGRLPLCECDFPAAPQAPLFLNVTVHR